MQKQDDDSPPKIASRPLTPEEMQIARSVIRWVGAVLAAIIIGTSMALGTLWLGEPYADQALWHGILGGIGAAVFVLYFAEAVWLRF